MLLNDVMSCKARWYISYTLKNISVCTYCTRISKERSHMDIDYLPDAVWFHCFSEDYKAALKNREKA